MQECLKLRITVAIIIECYLKSKYVGGFRQGTCAMLADDNINIVEYLLSTGENNHDKFNQEIENLKQDRFPTIMASGYLTPNDYW